MAQSPMSAETGIAFTTEAAARSTYEIHASCPTTAYLPSGLRQRHCGGSASPTLDSCPVAGSYTYSALGDPSVMTIRSSDRLYAACATRWPSALRAWDGGTTFTVTAALALWPSDALTLTWTVYVPGTHEENVGVAVVAPVSVALAPYGCVICHENESARPSGSALALASSVTGVPGDVVTGDTTLAIGGP